MFTQNVQIIYFVPLDGHENTLIRGSMYRNTLEEKFSNCFQFNSFDFRVETLQRSQAL